MVKHEFIRVNLETIKILIRSGDMSGTVMAQYKIFLTFEKLDDDDPKMDRYLETADAHGCSTRKVMSALKSMSCKI